MEKSFSFLTRIAFLVLFIIGALLPSQAATAAGSLPPAADIAPKPLSAPCGVVQILDNIVAANSAAPFTFYYDIGPQDNVAGMYIGYTITNTGATTSGDIWVKLDTFNLTTVQLAAGEDGVYHLGPLGPGASKPVYFYLVINGDPGDIAPLNETFQVNIYNNDPILGGEVCDFTDTINAVDETIDANANKVVTSVATANPPTIGSVMTITVVGETGTIGAGQIFKLSPASLSTWPADTFKMTGVHVDYWNDRVCPAAGGVPAVAPTNLFDRTLVFSTPSVKNSCYRIVYSFVINGTTTAPTDVMPVNEISSGQEIKHTGAYTNPILPIQSPLNATTLTKTVTPDAFPPAAGNTVTYTVSIRNTSIYNVTLDKFSDTLPAGTTYIGGTSAYDNTTISDPNIAGQVLTWSGMFTVLAGDTETLVYQATRNSAFGTFTNSVTAKIGSVQIDFSLDTANNSPAQASYVVAAPSPSLSIDKSTTTTGYDSVGDVLTYSYLLTNTGNVALSGPFTVVDDKSTNESCPATASLLPLATLTCSASYTVTQADIDAGAVTNHATAQGYYGAALISSAQDSVTINATRTPGLALEKTVLETSFDAIGDVLNYSYKVTNTGNTTLYNITVDDDKTSVSCPDTSAGLAPLGEITCTATYSIVAGDLTAGSVTNTATASSGTTTSNESSATVNLAQGTLTVIKIVVNDNGGTLAADDFSFSVNGSAATAFESDGRNDLNVIPGTYSVTETAPAGYSASYDNCTAVTVPEDGTATCTITNDDIAPSLTLIKTVTNDDGGTANAGDWTLTATGPTTLSGSMSGTGYTTPVASGADFEIGTYALSESGGPTGYTAGSWSCEDETGAPVDATGDQVSIGLSDTVICFINNDDNSATLTLIKTVINDNGGTALPDDFDLTVGGSSVLSGAANTLSANTAYSINETTLTGYNFVSITGDAQCPAALGGTVTLAPGDDVTCTITNDDIAPVLTLVKTVTNDDTGTANAGAWTLTATGPTTLSGSMSGAGYTIPVVSGAAFEVGTYTLSESGGPAGYTSGLWSCQDAAEAPVSVVGGQVAIGLADDFTCTINNNDNSIGSIAVEKTSTTASVTAADQVIPYTITLTNSGTLPLTGVTVNDPMCDAPPLYDSGDANSDEILQTTETWIYTCSHTVTQAELDAGGYLSNTVTADAGEADPAQDQLDISIAQGPAITLTKSGALDMTVVAPVDQTNAGDTVTYSFVVENTGNVSLVEDIVISDAKLNPVVPNEVCTISLADPLVVGETASCTATLYPYVLTAGDIAAGSVENTASAATTYDDDGDPATLPADVSGSDGAVVETSPDPGLSIEKSANPTMFTKTGDIIAYSYVLTNNGNINLYPPYYVTDDHIALVNCPVVPVALAPGESVTCTANYSITAVDVTNGSVTNVATAFAPWLPECTINTCIEIANSGETNARITRSGSTGGGGDTSTANVAAAAKLLPASGFAPGRVTPLDVNTKMPYASTEMSLEIPSLEVSAPITGVPFKEGWNVDWLWKQAGWLEGTAFPTSSGNSVITAHIYLPSGNPGPFVGITSLRWGDQILIKNDGKTYTYEVRSVKRVKPESVSMVLKHEDLSWLTLLTCQGYNAEENSYDFRVAVRAVLVSVK